MLNKKLYATIKSEIFFFLLLTAVVFCLYGKSINFDFTYHDDNSLILEKTEFLSNLKNIPQLFVTSCYYSGDFQYYRPILNLSFLLETTTFGLNTKIYHLTNIILFILALYSMYIFLLKLNANRTILKLLILLVSVHPILTSCVAWIPARNDTLLAIFIFLSFIFFVKYLKNNSFMNLLAYILFWTVALFTKETALLMLFVYVMFIFCFDYKLNKKEIFKNILIYVPIVIIYFYLRNVSVQAVGMKYYFTNMSLCLNNFITGISTYLYKFFIPSYIPIMLYDIGLVFKNIVVDIILLIIVLFSCYKKILNIKILLFSMIWFIAGLITTFLLQDYVYLNHRLIISLFGIVLLLAHIIYKLTTKYKALTKYLLALYIVLFFYYGFYSFNQQDKYQNKMIYFSNAYLDAPNYHGAVYWLARLHFESGNFDKAKELLKKTISLNNHSGNAYWENLFNTDLALIYYYEGYMDEAEELYKKSLESGIGKAQCYRNLSTIYLKRDKDINKAIEYAKLAVQEDPYDDGYKQYLQELQKINK
ncbi:MAG: tetratricopeptide repeat protein [Elusimicrobia bacterium]|nr:tetratricopeptide repeat protein [Elusimicrobiota bacterium]